MKPPIVIFDLDGTLAIIDKRREKATKPDGKINWKVFFDPENIALDEPNIPVVKTFQAMKQADFVVGIFSGRDSISIKETTEWLKENGVVFDFFKMRPQGSHTPDDVLKKAWLDELQAEGKSVMCVFDDRDKVVKMWRDNGITCMQVNYGDF
jgi:phosphoglycolate phosphatase-like HAD superfamily hydrolase